MATTSPKPADKGAPKKGRGRLYLALGLVALLVVGYVIYKRSSSSSSTGAPVTGSSSNPYGTSSDQGGGSGGGTADQTGADTAGLLSTLAGENQGLISAFLSGEQGLITLAGSSQGNPAPTTGASPAPDTSNPPPPAPVAPSKAPAAVDTGPNGPPVLGLSDITSTNLAAPGAPGNTTVNYMENVPSAPSIDAAAADVAASFYSAPRPASQTINYDIPSGAGAVKSGTAKTNYQAKARAT